MPKLRVGISDILDTRPLAWGFLKGHHADLFVPHTHSSGLVSHLFERGELEVALLPSIEAARLAGAVLGELAILPDLSVNAPGGSRSVVLLARRPVAELRRVAVARGAMTSRAALTILLAERFERSPELVDLDPQSGGHAAPLVDEETGVLLVGAAGLAAPREGFEVFDVARAWREHTGLPLVLGLWVVRPGVTLPDLPFYFKSSLRYGLGALGTIAREAAAEMGLDSAELESYFRDELSYFLRPEEIQGVAELYRRAHAHGILPSRIEPRFWTA